MLARKPAVAVILGSLSIGLFLIAWLYSRPGFSQDNPFDLSPVTGGEELIIDEDSISWLLTNNSSDDLYIETIDVIWPQEGGNLRQITFNGRIYRGEVAAPTASLDASMLGKEKLRMLPKGKDRTLQFKFDAENPVATQDQFLISVSFNNGTVVGFDDSVVEPPGDGLPPDPGEAGKSTLEGIDSDNDGVRDDVQRAIAQLGYKEPTEISALRQSAISTQQSLLAGEDVISDSIARETSFPAVACLDHVFGSREGRVQRKIIDAIVINTSERELASAKYNSRYFEFELDPDRPFGEYCD